MIRILGMALALVLAGCAGHGAAPPQTVARVDLARYAGTWFEIARFPNWFQDNGRRECRATTATYAPNADGTVGVVNRCLDAAGAPHGVEGSAYPVAGSGDAKLRVSFFWPFYGDYWVLGLDPDYRWAVVGAPGRDYLWILSRTPQLAPGDYAAAVVIAAGQGFEVSKLQLTPQPGG